MAVQTEEELDAELAQLILEANNERDGIEEEDKPDDNTDDNNVEDNLDENEDLGNDKNDDIDDDTDDEPENTDSEEVEDEDDTDAVEFEPIDIEVGNTKITINSNEELLAFAKKGASISDKKVESDADRLLAQGNLTKDDITLLVDAKNGDAKAIAKLAEIAKVDVLDLDQKMASEYNPNFKYQERSEMDIVIDEMMQDDAHVTKFRETISGLPSDFTDAITSNAKYLSAFSNHLKTGLADKILPLAIKEHRLNGGKLFDAYARIGNEISSKEPEVKETKKTEKRVITKREEELRRRSSSGADSESSEIQADDADSIWNMSEDEWKEYLASTKK